MGLFRRLHDYFATDIEVVVRGDVSDLTLRHGKHPGFLRRAVREMPDTPSFLLLGGLRGLPVRARFVSRDGAVIVITRWRLGMVDVRVRKTGRPPAYAGFYLAVGESYDFANPHGPDLSFRRIRHRDLRLPVAASH